MHLCVNVCLAALGSFDVYTTLSAYFPCARKGEREAGRTTTWGVNLPTIFSDTVCVKGRKVGQTTIHWVYNLNNYCEGTHPVLLYTNIVWRQ